MLPRIQSLKLQATFLRGRTAVAHAAAHDQSDGLDDAAHMARKLAKDSLPAGSPSSRVLHAGIAYVKGSDDRCATHLQEAAAEYDQHHMRLMAAACRHMRGRLIGGSEGATLQLRADDWMRGQGIVNPQRLTALLVGEVEAPHQAPHVVLLLRSDLQVGPRERADEPHQTQAVLGVQALEHGGHSTVMGPRRPHGTPSVRGSV